MFDGHYLDDSGCEIEGIRFWGSPITPEFCNWAFMREPRDIGRHWDAIPDDTDVLITHGPPHGILDQCPDSVGCEQLLEAVKRVGPKVHAFGHIHEGHGILEKDGTTFVNASIMDGRYRPVNAPIGVEV